MTTEASYYYTDAIDDLSHTSSLGDTAHLFEELDPVASLHEDSPSSSQIEDVLSNSRDIDEAEQASNDQIESEPSPTEPQTASPVTLPEPPTSIHREESLDQSLGRHGGRPLKPVETDQKLICKAIHRLIRGLLEKTEPNPKHRRPRNDIFKTRLVRACYKMSLDIIQLKAPALVRLTEYKSGEYTKYERSFWQAFSAVWTALAKHHIVNGNPTSKQYIDFICFHFPQAKVEAVAKEHKLEDHAEEMLKLRKLTTMKQYKVMAQKNSMFIPMLMLMQATAIKHEDRVFKSSLMLGQLIGELQTTLLI